MDTYQRQLLDKLITELTAITSPNLHTAQMLAAELKGAMQAQLPPIITIDEPVSLIEAANKPSGTVSLIYQCDAKACCDKIEALEKKLSQPTPDADGWVENTGVMPECEITAIKYKSGRIEETTEKDWHWTLEDKFYDITHYRPA